MIKHFNESKNILKTSANSNQSRNDKSISLLTPKHTFTSLQKEQNIKNNKNNQPKKKARMQLITYQANPRNLTTSTSENFNQIHKRYVDQTDETEKAYLKPVDTDIIPNFANLMNDISVTSKNTNDDNINQNYPEIPNDDEEETFNDSK
jgi:hypothetical protein